MDISATDRITTGESVSTTPWTLVDTFQAVYR